MTRRLLPLALVGILLGCGGSEATSSDGATVPTTTASDATSGSSAGPATTEAAAGDGAPAAVPEALRFTAPLLGGGDIEMATLSGRPVLLWFWAPW